MIEDAELLRAYADNRSEPAFAELVQRRIGLVYSVAVRQMGGDRHLAEDVVQEVFVRTARNAAGLSRHPVLSGWLYRTTQFVAIDLWRAEQSRRAREQEAQAMHESSRHPETAISEEAIRPVLDQLMADLNERDRNAIMLRFFEERPFADIGRKLKLTEDAARMRVDRALDRMRTALVRRGITSTTATLSAVLTTQAAIAAPASLTASATSAAFASMGAVGSTTVATLVFMSITKLQVGLAAALLIAGAFVLSRQRDEIARLERTPPPAATRIAAVPTVETQAPPVVMAAPLREDPVAVSADKWAGELATLQEALNGYPAYWIPELSLLNDRDWLIAAKGAKLETDEERRILFSNLRETAKNKFMSAAREALQRYLNAHDDQLPNTAADLATYLAPAFARPEIIGRYSMLHTGNVADLPKPDLGSPNFRLEDNWGLMAETASPVDPEYDTRMQWSLEMSGIINVGTSRPGARAK